MIVVAIASLSRRSALVSLFSKDHRELLPPALMPVVPQRVRIVPQRHRVRVAPLAVAIQDANLSAPRNCGPSAGRLLASFASSGYGATKGSRTVTAVPSPSSLSISIVPL